VSLRGVTAVLLGAVVVAPFLRVMVFGYLSPGTYLSSFLMPCRADALAMGVLLAIGWRSVKFRAWVGEHQGLLARILIVLALGFAGLSWWFAHPLSMVTVTIGYTWLGLFYSCLLLTVMSRKNGWIAGATRWGLLRRLGRISYCVYLIHLTLNVVAHRLILHGQPEIFDLRGVGVTLLALVVTLVIASASWRWFEQPLIRRGHSYSYWTQDAEVAAYGGQTGEHGLKSMPRVGSGI
jgi:peptidoglycan/LPS O-acetylase OafA/YrhL